MKILESIRDRVLGAIAGASIGGGGLLREAYLNEMDRDRAREGSADLELAADDVGWIALQTRGVEQLVDRRQLQKAANLSRVMYILNPLIKRAVTVQELYVWGSGCTIKAESEAVQEVLDAFLDDPSNQQVIGQAWPERERQQRIDGNQFFAFFVNPRTGAARVRMLPLDEIDKVICNPEDNGEPWYYVRIVDNKTILYPDIDYRPRFRLYQYDNHPIMWDVRVIHNKTGGLQGMKLGLPELYSVLNWATAYKRFLEQFATLMAAYARIAMKISNLGGKKGVAAAKSKLNTALTTGNGRDNNPPPNTAAWMAMSGGTDIAPIKTANSTTGPDEARALRSMVAAGTDTPEHFFGDSDIGNFATSTTLDRPTELKMIARQNMWKFVILRMCTYLIELSAQAPTGILRNAGFSSDVSRDSFDGEDRVVTTPPKGESLSVAVTFPSILERDVVDRVRAVVQAATLGGSSAEGIIPDRGFLFKLLMIALGEKDADALLEKYYPANVTQGFVDPAQQAANDKMEAEAKKLLGDAAMKAAEQPKAAPKAAVTV